MACVGLILLAVLLAGLVLVVKGLVASQDGQGKEKQARSRGSQTTIRQPQTIPVSMGARRAARVAEGQSAARGRSTGDPDHCWTPADRQVVVQGIAIRGGLIYVGKGLSAIRRGPEVPEPALINPQHPIAARIQITLVS